MYLFIFLFFNGKKNFWDLFAGIYLSPFIKIQSGSFEQISSHLILVWIWQKVMI